MDLVLAWKFESSYLEKLLIEMFKKSEYFGAKNQNFKSFI